MGAMILAEIGDFSRFDSPDKILAYAGASPSTYQSGQLESSYSHMEKRGSRYLRFALINAAKYVCHWDETFGAYLQKKDFRREALQRCHYSRHKETCALDLRNGKIWQALHKSGITFSAL